MPECRNPRNPGILGITTEINPYWIFKNKGKSNKYLKLINGPWGKGGGGFVHVLAPAGEKILKCSDNKRPSYLISRGRNPRNPIKILNKCPLSFHYFALKITYVPWAQNWSKDCQVFFLFHSCQRQRICTIHKNSKRGQKFLFLTIITVPQAVTKLSEPSILIDL